MTDKLREAAQAVGDAKDILFLREMSVHDKVYLRLEDAINALEAALAEQKPMLEMNPQKRPWVGLTDDEIKEIANNCRWSETYHIDFSRAIEAKLREKNG